jgi:manganese transport protein
MAPAFAVAALGVNATRALVISQVMLSITPRLPMISLMVFTRRPDISAFANRRVTGTSLVTVLVPALGLFLILQTLGVSIPGWS